MSLEKATKIELKMIKTPIISFKILLVTVPANLFFPINSSTKSAGISNSKAVS